MRWLFLIIIEEKTMNIYIYSDESGVFDKVHNDTYVYGGLVFLDKSSCDTETRKYLGAEKNIRKSGGYNINTELKACLLSNTEKYKLFKSLKNCYKFGVVISQKQVLDRIFQSKKDKQRYLDYAFKIGIKRFFQYLISRGIIDPPNVHELNFFVDEHTTATNGCYELRESLEQEFKRGTYNQNYSIAYPPIFNNLQSVKLNYCNSAKKTLIRAADITANHIYYHARMGTVTYRESEYMYITHLP